MQDVLIKSAKKKDTVTQFTKCGDLLYHSTTFHILFSPTFSLSSSSRYVVLAEDDDMPGSCVHTASDTDVDVQELCGSGRQTRESSRRS